MARDLGYDARMTLAEFDAYISDYLHIALFPNDPSQNGVQVQNCLGADGKGAVTKIAFAVDACFETIRRAGVLKADVLFVHHGLFWGRCEPVTGPLYKRIKALMDGNMALYACHLPLDAHPECGNNYGLAKKLGLKEIVPFGEWKGYSIGAMGTLPAPRSSAQIIQTLFSATESECVVLPFGKELLSRIAIVSGGGAEETAQAADAGADAFITGEIGHTQYHLAQENGITVIAAGHYNTETIGIQLVGAKIEHELGIETVFIDVPTGL
jgi:dinuclear metal center YbgI/SA1388 family protein